MKGQSVTIPANAEPIAEIDVLWITAGLGCDGDTIAMTAATQPSLEDILFGAIPWIPKVKLHNPFLAYDVGEDFLRAFHLAADRKLAPFILVIEGSIPNEQNKKEGYWASFGTNQTTGQPHHHLRMDRSPGARKRGPSALPIPNIRNTPMDLWQRRARTIV
jgi:Ni,Fe-hydrogenase I small subunit